MRFTTMMVCAGVLLVPVIAASAQTETQILEVGRVKTDVKRLNNTLAVTNQFTRLNSSFNSCVGICFFPGGAQSSNWTCSDKKPCQLDCGGTAPKGSC